MKTTHSSFNFKRVLPIAIAGVSLFLVPFVAFAQSTALTGAGATFPEKLYKSYFSELKKKNIDVNYNGVGSGAGIKQLIADTVDFGASDSAMTDAEIGQVKKGVLMIPTAGGAVALPYNLPGVKKLKLSKEALAGIFSGKITKWNDPELAKNNSGLPDKSIKLVVRADSSGTSFVFTNHLSAIDPNFKSKIGATKSPNWVGNPQKAKGNEGVASAVSSTDGAIGYVETAYAKGDTALVQNKAGEFVAPTVAEANKALENIEFPENFRVFEGNPKAGYPITGLTWLLLKKEYDAPKRAAIVAMVKWILTDGQKLNNGLGYTKVPKQATTAAMAAIDSQIKTAGANNSAK
jgi:phosphate transport system substrate-binding protein